MTRMITAYYDNRSDAQAASERLQQAGVGASQIGIADATAPERSTTKSETEHKGFFESIGDFFVPDEDRYTFEEGIRRGGSVLSVKADDREFDRVADILHESAVDLDSREREWRSEGWPGYDAARAGGDYIPVAEEQMRVGKREVDHGRVGIRSYVVETPVEEHVSLRDETVSVDRRPVDRAATSADRLFQDRSIEAEEHDEEAVVSKQSRVTEEVRLSKDVENRDETVRDTLKHTEVEVDDERTGGRKSTEEQRRRRGGAK